MKLNAIGVTSNNIPETVKFYSLLGFEFDKIKGDEDHVEPKNQSGIRLMIDSAELIESILGFQPKPSNHSAFALEFDTPEQVNETSKKLKSAGYEVFKEPWDAPWGQRYCIVKDPDNYLIDLYSAL